MSSPALPAQLRRPALVMMMLAALTFTMFAIHYSGRLGPGRLDLRIVSSLSATGLDRHVGARYVVLFGEPLAIGFFSALLALVAAIARRWRLAFLVVVGPLLTGFTTTVAKPLTGRLIAGVNLTFPSGHAAAATGVGVAAGLLVISVFKLRWSGLAILALGALVPGYLMSVAVVVAGWHYPTDTIAGMCAAVGVLLGSALLTDFVADRLTEPTTASPGPSE